MIKAKIVSVTINEAIGGVTKLDLETYLEDKVDLNSFYAGMDFDGLDAVIMTKEEYEAMDSASNVLRQSLLEEREETRKLKEEVEKLNGENQKERIKELEKEIEKSRSESRELMAKNIEIQYDRTITKMTNSRLSENVKEYKETIQKLREENEVIQKDIKELEEKLAQDAAELDIHPDGTMVFKSKRLSELEKEVKKLKIVKMDNYRLSIMVTELEEKIKKLEKENKDLKNKDEELKLKISDEFTLNITGGLFYKED